MYAMVNVRQYQIVATGTTVAEAEANYIKLLSGANLVAPEEVVSNTVSGRVEEIRTAVIEGNSWYYFRLIGERHYYAVSAAQCEIAVILNKGDKVMILDAAQEGDIRVAGVIRLS
jgi:hypothetical protein